MKKFLNESYVNVIIMGVVSWSLIGVILLVALVLGFFPTNEYSIPKTLKVVTKVENEAPIETEQHCRCKAIGASK